MLDEALVPAAEAGEHADPGFTNQERLAIRYAELMHRNPQGMSEQFVAELLDHFDEGEVVELGLAVAQFIGMGQLIHMLGLPNPTVVPVPAEG